MFSNETLKNCTIIRIQNLLPKKIKISDVNAELKDSFMFLARSDSRLLAYENLGFAPTKLETDILKKFIRNWGGGENVEVRNEVLEMELPSFLTPFHAEIDKIPGCRISPNLLRIGGDVFLTIEYHDTVRKQVSDTVMRFLSADHLFDKKLVYTGRQEGKLPYILKFYEQNGNDLDRFFMITTVWEFNPEDIRKQNNGVFQNSGSYVPKCFVNDSRDKLIFKTESLEIQGEGRYEVIDQDEKIVEIEIKSKFFSDFYDEVIMKYSGSIFCHMEVSKTRQVSYYLVDMNYQNLFLKGIQNNWKREARADHINYISSARKLSDYLN